MTPSWKHVLSVVALVATLSLGSYIKYSDTPVQEITSCEYFPINSYNRLSCESLIAQKSVATSTVLLVISSVVQVFAGIVTAFYIIQTFRSQKNADRASLEIKCDVCFYPPTQADSMGYINGIKENELFSIDITFDNHGRQSATIISAEFDLVYEANREAISQDLRTELSELIFNFEYNPQNEFKGLIVSAGETGSEPHRLGILPTLPYYTKTHYGWDNWYRDLSEPYRLAEQYPKAFSSLLAVLVKVRFEDIYGPLPDVEQVIIFRTQMKDKTRENNPPDYFVDPPHPREVSGASKIYAKTVRVLDQ